MIFFPYYINKGLYMYTIIIDNSILDEYNKYYFKTYPNRRKIPIEKTIAPTLNSFISKIRMEQNSIKQKYKEFSISFLDKVCSKRISAHGGRSDRRVLSSAYDLLFFSAIQSCL